MRTGTRSLCLSAFGFLIGALVTLLTPIVHGQAQQTPEQALAQCRDTVNRVVEEYKEQSVSALQDKITAKGAAEALRLVTGERDKIRVELDELKKQFAYLKTRTEP